MTKSSVESRELQTSVANPLHETEPESDHNIHHAAYETDEQRYQRHLEHEDDHKRIHHDLRLLKKAGHEGSYETKNKNDGGGSLEARAHHMYTHRWCQFINKIQCRIIEEGTESCAHTGRKIASLNENARPCDVRVHNQYSCNLPNSQRARVADEVWREPSHTLSCTVMMMGSSARVCFPTQPLLKVAPSVPGSIMVRASYMCILLVLDS